MSRNGFSITYDHSNPAHKTMTFWNVTSALDRTTVGRTIRRYARICGEALVLRANASVVRYWYEHGKVRQRTYTKVHFITTQEPSV